jgi:hypothetical protein
MEQGFNYKIKQNFDDFEHFEDNEVGLVVRKLQKRATKSFGIVIYGTKSIYANNKEIDINNHIWCNNDKKLFLKSVIDFLKYLFLQEMSLDVEQITLGHEHGTENGKCHFQIVLQLKDICQKLIKPCETTIMGINMLMMCQVARKTNALTSYCKKDGDFYFMDELKAIRFVYKVDKKGEKTNKVDAFATVVQNPEMSKENKMDLLLTHEPRTALTMYKNLEYAVNKLEIPPQPEFKWRFPEWLRNSKKEYENKIEEWFIKHCEPENMDRRRGLFLLGYRGSGKTRFAKYLVGQDSGDDNCENACFWVSFRDQFNKENLANKDPKLVILDDMKYDKEAKETWKALAVGQQVNVSGKYQNFFWDKKIPCIVATNNRFLYKQFLDDPEFKTSFYFVEIPPGAYLGRPGTQIDDKDEVIACHTLKMEEDFQRFKEEKEDFKRSRNATKPETVKRERSRNYEFKDEFIKNDKEDYYIKLECENKQLKRRLDTYESFLKATNPEKITLVSLYNNIKQ